MTSLTGSTATLRRRLFGVLTATAVGGATAVVLLSAPSAVGASDPCAASEMARAIGNVARSAVDCFTFALSAFPPRYKTPQLP